MFSLIFSKSRVNHKQKKIIIKVNITLYAVLYRVWYIRKPNNLSKVAKIYIILKNVRQSFLFVGNKNILLRTNDNPLIKNHHIHTNNQKKRAIHTISHTVSNIQNKVRSSQTKINVRYENNTQAIMKTVYLQNLIIGFGVNLLLFVFGKSSSLNRSQQCLHFFALFWTFSAQYGHFFILHDIYYKLVTISCFSSTCCHCFFFSTKSSFSITSIYYCVIIIFTSR